MTDDFPSQGKLVSLSLAVPGWQGRLIPEAVEKVAQGVAIEQKRLWGSNFLVVLRREELSYHGMMEWIEIVSGHTDIASAAAAAQIVGAQRMVEMGRTLDPKREWKHADPTARMIRTYLGILHEPRLRPKPEASKVRDAGRSQRYEPRSALPRVPVLAQPARDAVLRANSQRYRLHQDDQSWHQPLPWPSPATPASRP